MAVRSTLRRLIVSLRASSFPIRSRTRSVISNQLTKQSIADALKLDGAMAQLLLETVCKSQGNPNQKAIADLLALSIPGLSASYCASDTLDASTGTVIARTDQSIAFDGNGASPDTQI